ncbi:phosphodiesterase YaeI [Pelagicoccus sp. SDUM812003]|uniref:phosphodiesterase YaeI n=1 Tax=Pelagicoccus sp. SDUM812003 TaxID=3041267 RepID=UPI00280CD77E|nr:phosphodiesterase YaeI [Pelagicoccus sp. SDUM812003]MDQ8202759.1 phosphodiesterase YaeI [Pelagicoccus sp. SDUM812003]
MKRRNFLKAALALSATSVLTAWYLRFFESKWAETTEKSVKTDRLKTPIRILHLSDFHASNVVPYDYLETSVKTGLGLRPDIILLTGDFITDRLMDEGRYRSVLSPLAAAAPTFACIGNHDGGLWAGSTYGYSTFEKVASLLDACHIRLLFNETTTCSVGGQQLQIAGLGDLWSRDTKPELALERHRSTPGPVIVLSHNPDSKELLAPYDWDLMCCGHTHGGQLVVPFFGYRPFLPVRDKAFAEGLHVYRDRHIHITRGVGNLHGLRFNCRPEISLLRFS